MGIKQVYFKNWCDYLDGLIVGQGYNESAEMDETRMREEGTKKMERLKWWQWWMDGIFKGVRFRPWR